MALKSIGFEQSIFDLIINPILFVCGRLTPLMLREDCFQSMLTEQQLIGKCVSTMVECSYVNDLWMRCRDPVSRRDRIGKLLSQGIV